MVLIFYNVQLTMEKIYVLGPKYSYSYNVAARLYDSDYIVCVDAITDVVTCVAQGSHVSGIIPIENMLNGSVRETFRALQKNHVYITRAIDFCINHVIAAKNTDFGKIASHAQSLAQCSTYIRSQEGVEVIEVSSTSKAMEMAANDPKIAAIGNEEAARYYGLQVIDTDVSNKSVNVTRFIEIIKDKTDNFASGTKTSMIITPQEDRTGLLFEILSIFQVKRINLTKIESIPTGNKMNDYLFYIDIDGALSDQHVIDALAFLRTFVHVDVFGSYDIEEM